MTLMPVRMAKEGWEEVQYDLRTDGYAAGGIGAVLMVAVFAFAVALYPFYLVFYGIGRFVARVGGELS